MRLGLVAVLTFAAGAAGAQDIGGRYEVAGKGFDGSAYRGTAVITITSNVTCEIVWNTGGQVSRGICMRQGNTFAASYVLGNTVGMVIYDVAADGSMSGTWTLSGSNGVGYEALYPAGG